MCKWLGHANRGSGCLCNLLYYHVPVPVHISFIFGDGSLDSRVFAKECVQVGDKKRVIGGNQVRVSEEFLLLDGDG